MNHYEIIRYLKKKFTRIILFPLRLFPVNRHRILLINNLSKTFSDNQKYLGIELSKQPDLEIYYAGPGLSCQEKLKEYGIKPVVMNTFKYFYVGMTSQVLVTNSAGFSYMPLRKKQYIINTWHGGGAYKVAGTDMFENSKLFRKDLLFSSKNTNVFLSTNKRFTKEISRAMLVPIELFWEIGMPRNDCLITKNTVNTDEIKKKIGLKEDQKLVLYAPTYRKPDDNYFRESITIQYNIDSEKVCKALHDRFSGDWVFGYRLHPCVKNKADYIINGALDLSEYDDMQELLQAADVLINDFSSSFWDYMLTEKPCFLYAPDLDHYIEATKVYTPVSEWPFPKSRTNEELADSILSFDEDKYLADCHKHYEDLGGCESGKATDLVCERIINVCKGNIVG